MLGPALVPREMRSGSVRLIDLEASPPTATRRRLLSRQPLTPDNIPLKMLWSDLLAAPSSEVVAYRGGARWTRTYERIPFASAEGGREKLKHGGVYLFTGGLGGISRTLASSLATEFRAKLVMIGRTERRRARLAAYRRQQSRPSSQRHRVHSRTQAKEPRSITNAPITDPSRWPLHSTPPPIASAVSTAFSTAGAVDDGLMPTKTVDSIEKCSGQSCSARVSLRGHARQEMRTVVLFSSISTVTAPAGQADYVAANSYLDAYADYCLANADRRTISLHWGVWDEVGMAARSVGIAPLGLHSDEAPHGHSTLDGHRTKRIACLEVEVGPDTRWYLDQHLTSAAPSCRAPPMSSSSPRLRASMILPGALPSETSSCSGRWSFRMAKHASSAPRSSAVPRACAFPSGQL